MRVMGTQNSNFPQNTEFFLYTFSTIAILLFTRILRNINGLKHGFESRVWKGEIDHSGVPGGWVGRFKPPFPRNSEVLTKLSRIPSSVENTSITT
jgi:hypothetical protein